MNARFELFDHTADLGVRVVAPTLAELVRLATAGFYATIGEVVAAGMPTPVTFDLSSRGDDPAVLLRDYLAELLHRFERDALAINEITVDEFTPRRFVVRGAARALDTERSILLREVKAITYHELTLRPVEGGYEATYIVDI